MCFEFDIKTPLSTTVSAADIASRRPPLYRWRGFAAGWRHCRRQPRGAQRADSLGVLQNIHVVFRNTCATPLSPAWKRCESKQGTPPFWRLPTRWRLLEHRDRLILDRQVTTGHEILEQTADHVARGADAFGHVLLREFFRDDQRTVPLDSEGHDQADKAPVDIGQRQTLDAFGGRANTLDELLD